MYLLKILIFIFLFLSVLNANVNINIPNTSIKNEVLVFSIEASGSDITFPNISKVNGNVIQELSSSSSITVINTQVIKKIKKTYSFYPQEDFILPSLEFIIDGKKYLTKEKIVILKNPERTKSDIFDLYIETNKSELYVGEDFILTVIFKYKKDTQILDLGFVKPVFNDFWHKQLNDSKQYEENSYIVQELKFLLFPLKEGLLSLNPINVQAQVVDTKQGRYSLFSNAVKTLKIYSNDLQLDVKALPKHVNLIGEFDIKAQVDKTLINNGDAISYKLSIVGFGNIDDIDDIKLNIPNSTVYENKPEIKTSFKDNKYSGIYTKVFSIIPSESIVIPEITLSYYDKQNKQIIVKKTKKFHIEVKNTSPINTNEKLQKSQKIVTNEKIIKVIEKSSIKENILYFSLGIICTLLILSLYFYVIKQRVKKQFNDIPLIKRVKQTNTKEELLKVLAVYIKIDSTLDILIFKIEQSDNINLLKKEIIKLLKQIHIEGKTL